MKLVKFVPTLVATVVLAACSTAENIASGTANAVKGAATATTDAVKGATTATTDAVKGAATATSDAVKGATTTVVDKTSNAVNKTKETLMTKTKSVAYKCGSMDLVVDYAFYENVTKGANVRLGKNTQISGFVPDQELSKKVDSPVFVAGEYTLTTDKGLAVDTAEKTDFVMLTKNKGETTEILAKNCSINTQATKKLNK